MVLKVWYFTKREPVYCKFCNHCLEKHKLSGNFKLVMSLRAMPPDLQGYACTLLLHLRHREANELRTSSYSMVSIFGWLGLFLRNQKVRRSRPLSDFQMKTKPARMESAVDNRLRLSSVEVFMASLWCQFERVSSRTKLQPTAWDEHSKKKSEPGLKDSPISALP